MTKFSSFLPTLTTLFCLLLFTNSNTREILPNYDLGCVTLEPVKSGFTISGNAASDAAGFRVSSAGDIDNDGYDDIIVSAAYKNGLQGAVYVIYGGPTSSLLDIDLSLQTLDPATTGFKLTGRTAGDYFGWSVASAGDIDNDGYDDIIIGAHFENSLKGVVYVIYGGPRSSMSNYDFSVSTTVLDPKTTGFMVTGRLANSLLGATVSSAGDINKDGYDDIIMGAYRTNGYQGEVYVIYGGPKSSMSNYDFSVSTTVLDPKTTGFKITGPVITGPGIIRETLGYSVSTAGDFNNDGYDDIIVGAVDKNSKGGVYVIYGGPKSSRSNIDFTLSTTVLDPATTGFIIMGNAVNDQFGNPVNFAGDINNDGYSDIIVGVYVKNTNQGAAYVIYGGPSSSMSNIDLGSQALDPATTGFQMTGAAANNYFGRAVASAGDINKDGYDDIIVGAYGFSGNMGKAYVIYGGPKSSMSNIDFSLSTTVLDPATTGFTITGKATGNLFGIWVRTAGDINNDGYDDIIIGAQGVNGGKGAAYVIHNACLTAHCDSCTSRFVCDKCTTPYILFDSWCLPDCPTRTYSSNNVCIDCPIHCSSCTSQESCQTCDQGYTLLESLCASPTSLHAQDSSMRTISSVARGVGSVVSIGGSIFPLTSLVSKIVQNTRYINLTVTDELTEIYQTWDTDLISWDVPNLLSRYDHFETVPTLFARYEIDSPFLANFWPTLVNIIIGLGTFITSFGLKKYFERSKYNKHWVYSLLLKLLVGSFNFTLVQAYTCLDDILFYLVLDAKTNPFNTFFCWVSLFFAIGFLALGCYLIWLNLKTVKNYQALKKDTEAIEAFNEKNKYWELFYSDFNDENFWSQFALTIFLVRSTLSSLIIAVFYEYPVMQTAYLIIIDVAIISFLYFEKPFVTFLSTLCQYFYEIITLLVHICTCILSMQGTEQNPSEDFKRFLSNSIIYLNTALVTGSIGFMFIEIYKTLRQKMKKRKQYEAIATQTFSHKKLKLDFRNTASYANAVSQRAEIQNRKHSLNNAPLENLHLLSNVTQENNNSFTGMNLQPSNRFNAEDSIFPNIETNDQIIEERHQNPASVVILRPKIRKVRIQQQ